MVHSIEIPFFKKKKIYFSQKIIRKSLQPGNPITQDHPQATEWRIKKILKEDYGKEIGNSVIVDLARGIQLVCCMELIGFNLISDARSIL